ncbi:MAG TPA: sigma-70 family RNA polymerase sigma factor [Tepidisphaeraceae bacterium]|jgi:RNA polymerase sigma factor (sigma-70 family)|nr:sigma-70 family RNA polymerase sigma factor [Tepidisphaeraceae bacterium]
MAEVINPMDDASDRQLLREYAASGSQDAFARLVRRHVDKVYSAALRQVGKPHQADDITQAVFIALSRKAPILGGQVVIGGWLMKATHLAAKNLHRTESRRQIHELHAAQQRTHDMSRSQNDPVPAPDPHAQTWNSISPLLDAALSRLPDALRDALTLRYFEGRDFATVARVLGITEQAARKRVERALEKLRGIFASLGITVPSEVLGQVLLAYGVCPAPPAVVHAAAAAAINHLTLAKGVVTVMAWSKAKVVAFCVAGALVAGGTGVLVHKVLSARRAQVVVLPEGKPPVITAVAPVAGFELHGQVVFADGRPVAGAQVIAATDPRPVVLNHDPQFSFPPQISTLTDAIGEFHLNSAAKPRGVVVSCPEGFARATTRQLAQNLRLTLVPWGRIEGNVTFDGVPATGAQIMLAYTQDEPRLQINIAADNSGHYLIPQAPSGRLYMACIPVGQRSFNGYIGVPSGGTCTIDFISRAGRSVVARLAPLPDPGEINAVLWLDPSPPPSSGEGRFELSAYQQNLMAQSGESPKVRFDHIPPGNYRLNLNLIGSSKVWLVETRVTVPPASDGAVPADIDAGTLALKSLDAMRPRKPKPAQSSSKPAT